MLNPREVGRHFDTIKEGGTARLDAHAAVVVDRNVRVDLANQSLQPISIASSLLAVLPEVILQHGAAAGIFAID
jgi:hypothetical protein